MIQGSFFPFLKPSLQAGRRKIIPACKPDISKLEKFISIS